MRRLAEVATGKVTEQEVEQGLRERRPAGLVLLRA